MRDVVSSRKNPAVQHFKRLGTSAAYRRNTGLFVGEGLTLLREALAAHWTPVTVAFTPDTPLPDLPGATQRLCCTEAVMATMSPSQTPPGLLFAARLPVQSPPMLPSGRYLFLDRVQDPGNVGSILRSARAFGIQGACYTDDCADPFAPKTLRAAMGASFCLPLWKIEAPEAFLSQQTLPLLAAVPDTADADIRRANLSQGIFVLGNEAVGIRPGLLALCGLKVRIPMMGQSESLGVAAAAAVFLWEAFCSADREMS